MSWPATVNPEIFLRILFLIMALKYIFVTLKIATRAWFTYISKRKSDFARILFSRNFAYGKFGENKTLMKISEFTVLRRKSLKHNILMKCTTLPVSDHLKELGGNMPTSINIQHFKGCNSPKDQRNRKSWPLAKIQLPISLLSNPAIIHLPKVLSGHLKITMYLSY